MASTTDHGARADAPAALPAIGPADWLIRASLAGTFLYHGVTKFPSLAAGAEMTGLPLWLWTLVAVVETAGGLAILAGGVTRSRSCWSARV